MTMVSKSPQPSYKPPYLIRLSEGKTEDAVGLGMLKNNCYKIAQDCWQTTITEVLKNSNIQP